MFYQEFSKACGIDCFLRIRIVLGNGEQTKIQINGLLREYLPKGQDLTEVLDITVELFVSKLNLRPRSIWVGKHPMRSFMTIALNLTICARQYFVNGSKPLLINSCTSLDIQKRALVRKKDKLY